MKNMGGLFLILLALVFSASTSLSADTVELTDGTTINGKLVEINQEAVTIDIESGRRVIPIQQVARIDLPDAEPREFPSDEQDLFLLETLLASRSFLRADTRAELRQLAAAVPPDRRRQLYYVHKRDLALAMAAINVVIPGLGSFLQYDWAGGIVQILLYGGAYLVLYLGITGIWDLEDPWTLNGIGGLIAANFVFGVVRPFWWSASWNRRLSEALDISLAVLSPVESGIRLLRTTGGAEWGLHLSVLSVRYWPRRR